MDYLFVEHSSACQFNGSAPAEEPGNAPGRSFNRLCHLVHTLFARSGQVETGLRRRMPAGLPHVPFLVFAAARLLKRTLRWLGWSWIIRSWISRLHIPG